MTSTSSYPLTLDLERGGERFHLIHILPRRIMSTSDWLLFGHTHRPADEMHNGVHLFNPGSAGRANKGAPLSVGFLTREKGKKFRRETCCCNGHDRSRIGGCQNDLGAMVSAEPDGNPVRFCQRTSRSFPCNAVMAIDIPLPDVSDLETRLAQLRRFL